MSRASSIALLTVAGLAIWLGGAVCAYAWPQQGQGEQHRDRRGQGNPHEGLGSGKHRGDWLRQHQNQPPEQQERELRSDPKFRQLPPDRQQELVQKLRDFNSKPPEQRQRILERMETFEHLPPGEQQRIRSLYGQMRALPDDRRHEVRAAARELRGLPPDQRERVINSPQFRSRFSEQERDLVRGLSSLNLGPEDAR
jgi:hypothetical protein